MKKRSLLIGYDEVYLLSLCLYLFRNLFLANTNWAESIINIASLLNNVFLFLNAGLFVVMILFKGKDTNIPWLISLIITTACMILSFFNTGSTDLLFTTLFALFAYRVSVKKILKCFFWMSLASLGLSIFSYVIGMSYDKVVKFDYGTGHSLGIAHPNTMAALILSILVTWEVSYNEMRINMKMIVYFAISAVVVWEINMSRTGLILIALLPVLLLLINLSISIKVEKVLWLVRIAIIVVILGAFYLTFSSGSQVNISDSGFRYRFAFPYRIYSIYGIHPFGNNVDIHSLYGSWIDSSYLYMLIICGYFPTIIILLMIFGTFRRLYKKELYPLLAILFIFVLQGITEEYMNRISYNVSFLLLFSELDIINTTDREEIKQSALSDNDIEPDEA